jgi:hypothetical protein
MGGPRIVALARDATVRIGPPAPRAAGNLWLAPSGRRETVSRERTTKAAVSTTFGAVTAPGGLSLTRQDLLLSPEQRWMIYQRTPDVRASIDGIVRRVATWDWLIRPVEALDPRDKRYPEILERCEAARRFLAAPNRDGETFQELFTKVCVDLLVHDAGATEIVGSRARKLEELVATRGELIRPVHDELGRLQGYRQELYSSTVTSSALISPDQIVYLRLFPTTRSHEGLPLLESLVNEVVSILRSSEHAMMALDADEIPPGILVLAGLAKDAARDVVTSMRDKAGQDHKIRILTPPKIDGVEWLELRRSMKDLDLVPVVDQIRRTIWRVFGVMPVEMGATDGMPRATAQVQVDVSSSHLITPILELLAAKINARILPILLTDAKGKPDPELASLVEFVFADQRKKSADDLATDRDSLGRLVDKAILTRNESRKVLGFAPSAEPAADVLMLTTAAGAVPLSRSLEEPAAPPAPGEDDDAPDDDGSEGGDDGDPKDGEGDDTPEVEPGDDEDDDAPPGEVEDDRAITGVRLLSRPGHEHAPGCGCGPDSEELGWATLSDLPSDWQPEGRFKNARTIRLDTLGEIVSGYRRSVEPLWAEAQSEILAAIRSEYREEGFSSEDGVRLRRRLDATISKLRDRWSLAVGPAYYSAARVGRDAASRWTGASVGSNWERRAELYRQRAMGYLSEPGGLVNDYRIAMTLLVQSVTRSKSGALDLRVSPRSGSPGSAAGFEDLKVGATKAALAEVAMAWIQANEPRIDNWSGRLVELANSVAKEEIVEASTVADEDGKPSEQSVEWWVIWEYVGDKRVCRTCLREGTSPARPLSTLPTMPGGATECRARCRCVLTFWTQAEVSNGTAVRLAGP